MGKTKQKYYPNIKCIITNSDGSYKEIESSNFGGSELTKSNFYNIIDFLHVEKENYKSAF